jgi:hypothetical protein
MPGQNIIELGFDIDKLTKEKQEVLSLFVDLFGKLREFDGSKFDPLGGKGFADLRQSIQDTGKAMGEYQQLGQKFNQTMTDQAAKYQEAKKAADSLGVSQKQYAHTSDEAATSQDLLRKQATSLKVEMEDVARSINKLRAAFTEGNISESQYKEQLEPLIARQLSLKVANTDVTKTLTVLEKQFQSAAGSTVQLENRLKELQGVYDKLSPESRNADAGKTLLKEIQDVDAAFKALKGDTGRFQDNVGNYSGAFQNAFKVLQEQLATVKGQMGDIETKAQNVTGRGPIGFDRNRFKGDVTNFVDTGTGGTGLGVGAADAATYQELANKEQILNQITERVAIGFKSTRQEARAFQEAATQLGLTVGLESEEFQVFNKAIGDAQNGINDIKAATKFQASDAKLIVGLADAASTAAGAFGAWQAAESLLGNDNEDLQKQMAKFQQLLVLINGLQAVANGLQAESGGIQLLLSARTNLMNAARSVQLLLTTRAVQVITAETAATAANVAAKEADAAATGEVVVAEGAQTAATAANTEATIANTAAQGGAKAATANLSTAFIAGGIAALAIGAGVALALLTAKLIGYGTQAGLTIEQQEKLADAMKESNQVIIEQSEFIKTLDDSTRKYYQNQLSLAQAAGKNQYQQFALQKQIALAERDSAQQQIDALGANNKQQAELAGTIQLLNARKAEALRIEKELLAIPEKDQTGDQKDQLKAAAANVEFYQKQIDGIKGLYDAGDKARQDLFASNQKLGQLDLAEAKFSADERRKLALETAKLEIEAVKDKNAKILSDERSTDAQRLAAIQSDRDAEVRAAGAEFDAIDPNATNAERTEAARRRDAAIAAADRDFREKEFKERRSFYERDRDAALEIYKSQQEEQSKIDEEILSKQIGPGSKGTTGDAKLDALTDQYTRQRNLLDAQEKNDLDQLGLKDEQRKAIEQKYNDQFLDLQRKYLNDYRNVEDEIREASLAAWELYYERRKNQIDKGETSQIALLNELSEHKLISDKEYSRRRTVIEDQAAVERAAIAVKDAQIQVAGTEANTKARADAEGRYNEAVKSYSDARKKQGDDTDKIAKEKLTNTLDDINQVSQNAAGAFNDVIDIGYNRQKVKLQELEALQEKNYEADQSRIQNSTISEQEKSAQLVVLEKNRQQQKEINDRKQRQLDMEEARFQKAKDILGIITGTALAVVKALPNIPLAISIGILGAGELAAAVATPLPKYKFGAGIPGRPVHMGGLAEVGDGFEPELIKEPGKKAYWSPSVPTTLDLKPYTQVMTLDYINSMMHDGMFVNQYGSLVMNRDDEISRRLDLLNNTMVWHAGVVSDASKRNRPVVHVHNHIGREARHQAWIDKNVRN